MHPFTHVHCSPPHNTSHMVAELERVPCPGSCNICSGEQYCPGFGNSNDLTLSCPSVSASFDRRQTTTLVADSSACEEADLVSAGGDPHVNNATGEKNDLWNTGRFSFVLIPKDVQPRCLVKTFLPLRMPKRYNSPSSLSTNSSLPVT